MSTFFELLEKRAEKSLLCIGLDPRAKTAEEAKKQCIALIDATHPYAAAYKPNAAFFEVFGAEGWTALKAVIQHVPSGIPVVLDAKRGDIGDTSKAYATAAFRELGAHCITASPYMGSDSLAPFLADPTKGVFALCKTSNKGSNELQQLQVGGGLALFEKVAQLAETQWNGKKNLGLVVGATDPNAIGRVRKQAPSLWFLVPGVGAQGGDLAASLSAGLRTDGSGMLINVSRAVAGARNPGAAAQELCETINRARGKVDTLATSLVSTNCVRFGSFKLKSGIMSPFYLDLRRLVSAPQLLGLIAKEYSQVLKDIQYDRLVGLPYAALPIATAVSLEVNKPMIYPRRETKQYGTKAAIEGDFKAGEKVVIIDDLVTTGETKIEAIDKLKAVGLEVVAIVVLIDREMGATKFLGDRGFTFKAVTSISTLLAEWERKNTITSTKITEVRDFLSGKSKL